MIILFVLSGMVTGLLSGMLGIGGGVITVPVLYFVFYHVGMPALDTMQVAACTSLAISLGVTLFSSIVQHSKKAIEFSIFKFLLPGLAMGCIAGALLAHFVSSELIRRVFGVGALLIGMSFSIPRLPHLKIASAPNSSLSLFGLMIGALSSLLGIGGGILTFPTLLGYGISTKTASATSSCTTAFSSLIGTISYLLIAKENPPLFPDTFGYIYVPAFLVIGISALFTTQLGVYLSHVLDTHLIKMIFGICLSLVGLTIIIL